VHVLRHAANLGKGRALKTGINHFLTVLPGFVGLVTADADGQHTLSDIVRVTQSMLAKPGCVALACRRFSGKVPLRSRFGNELTRLVFHFFSGRELSDTQTGLRAFPSSLLLELLPLHGERYEYEMTVLALSTGTHTIIAIYSGDSNFAANSSQALVQTVLDFSIPPVPSIGSAGSVQTVLPGQAATYGFYVQPIAGTFPYPISLSATGLPPGATVVFSPQAITMGANPSRFTMTVQTPTAVSARLQVRDGGTISVAGCLLLLPLSSWLRHRRRGGIALGCIVILSCLPLIALTGCGTANGFVGQSQQSYSIQVNGTVNGGAPLHLATVKLTVQ
jgi:hypothetical protein